MLTLDVRLEAAEDELLDATEEIRRVLESGDELCPPLRALLLAVDDAVTEAFAEKARPVERAPVRVRPDARRTDAR